MNANAASSRGLGLEASALPKEDDPPTSVVSALKPTTTETGKKNRGNNRPSIPNVHGEARVRIDQVTPLARKTQTDGPVAVALGAGLEPSPLSHSS
jgi:hypothetical protein